MQQRAAVSPSIAQTGTLVGNPSRALPSQTVASFTPRGITEYVPHVSKSKHSRAKAFTGQPSKPGPATLPEAHSLAEHLGMPKTSENLRALVALHKHREFVEKSTPYKDALAVERPPSLIPSTSRIENIVPEPVAHMPPMSRRPKGTPIMTIGLPLADNKGKGKKVDRPVVEVSDNNEPIGWGTDDEGPQGLYDNIAAGLKWQLDTEHGDYHDSVAYNHIAPQVPFLTTSEACGCFATRAACAALRTYKAFVRICQHLLALVSRSISQALSHSS